MKKRRGEIVKVSTLFEKYRLTLKAPQGVVVKEFLEVITDVTGITLTKAQVKYSVYNKTISLNAPSMVKQEIKLRHDEILVHLKGRLGVGNEPKIIL